MGKKSKIGKQRKDVFYRRAKEAGYRARAAYKLIQLNKKYNFLQSSRVCIDLCAAPGSWMQVCSKFMPVSSIIIGIDRYPIAPIPNAIGIQGDITTEKVRQDLKGQLKTWKADLVLHDGAPNVGQNWLHDAYQQNLLVLHAFKLACQFLQKGGTFVSKIFRSKDHLSLEYVFKKLFKRVEATKPIASRFESAEIFVVCQGYLAPDKIDPQFFDARYVFQSLESEPKNKIDVLKPEKSKRKAGGYEEGITMLYKRNKISDFIKSKDYIEVLEETNEFEWDSLIAKESVHTTTEIIEFCKDIKVLGRKDLRSLLNWRKKIISELEELEQGESLKKLENDKQPDIEEKDEIEQELEELEKIQVEVASLQAEKQREEKQHKKKIEKKKKRLEEKLKLRLMVPGDPGPQETGRTGLFSIKSLDNTESLSTVIDQDADILADSDDSDTEGTKKRFEYYSKEGQYLSSDGTYRKRNEGSSDSESESEDSDAEGLNLLAEADLSKVKGRKSVTFADEDEEQIDDDSKKTNPLTTDLVGDNILDKRERKAETWFSKEMFDDLEDDEIEDFEIESAIQKHQELGGTIRQKKLPSTDEGYTSGASDKPQNNNKRKFENKFSAMDAPDSDSDDDSDKSASDSDEEEETKTKENFVNKSANPSSNTDGPLKKKRKREIRLTDVGLALATKMIRSKKAERDIYDESWNKHMLGDEDLPEWFAEDEKRHNMPEIKVDKEDLKMYQEKNKAVDARTIKKVVEAKARKQRRIKKRMTRARKKAEVIANNLEMSSREQAVEMKKIYKKAASIMKPKDKKYVVMKKSFGGRKPKGIKGPTVMVDRRLKKDKRSTASNMKRAKGNKRK